MYTFICLNMLLCITDTLALWMHHSESEPLVRKVPTSYLYLTKHYLQLHVSLWKWFLPAKSFGVCRADHLSWRRNPFRVANRLDWFQKWPTFSNTGISLEGQKYVTLKATVFAAFVPKGQTDFFSTIYWPHTLPTFDNYCPQTCQSPLKSHLHPLLQ